MIRWRATDAQAALWIDAQGAASPSLYNVGRGFVLPRGSSTQAAAAAAALQHRHDVLSSAFRLDGETLFQELRPGPPSVEPGFAPDGSAERAAITSFASRPIDLERGPAARWLVQELGDSTLLGFVAHHVVCDASSLLVLERDLGAVLRGEALRPLPPDRTFAAFAAESAPLVRRPPPASDPFRWPAGAGGDANAEDDAAAVVELDPGDLRLARAASALRASIFTLYGGALAVAVARVLSGPVPPFYVPFGARDERFAETAGCFVRPLAVAPDVAPADAAAVAVARFGEALDTAVRASLAGEPRAPARSRPRVALTVEDRRAEPPRLPIVDPEVTTSKFDLTVTVFGSASGWRVRLAHRLRALSPAYTVRIGEALLDALRESTSSGRT